MNPELIERPHEIAYYRKQRRDKSQGLISSIVVHLLLAVGFVTGWLWREIYELIF